MSWLNIKTAKYFMKKCKNIIKTILTSPTMYGFNNSKKLVVKDGNFIKIETFNKTSSWLTTFTYTNFN